MSGNVIPAVCLCLDNKCGSMSMCNIMEGAHKTPEMLAVNPFHQIPSMKDGDFCLAEGDAILRYVARQYATASYPSDAKAAAMQDWALSWASSSLSKNFQEIWYPVAGFGAPPADQKVANESMTANLDKFEKKFLSNSKLIGGDKLMIADYKIGAWIWYLSHSSIKASTGFVLSERCQKYATDFFESLSDESKKFLTEDDMNAKGFMDSKAPAAGGGAAAAKALGEKEAADNKEVVAPAGPPTGRPNPQLQSPVKGSSGGTNAAFVFIKPHAATDKVKELAKRTLESKGIKILAEGSLSGETIDEKKLIDKHYYAIAEKATIKKPSELNVPNDKFKEQFGIDWKAALDSGKVFNALDGCKELGVDAEGMAAVWKAAQDGKKLVKLGGGFYCGLVKSGDKELYIMNGFFMSMRSKFTKPGSQIYYYNVEWDSKDLSWADFRGKVLGPTDPKLAPEDALRGMILKDWKDLGLTTEPNVSDNGMHASASPFEGLAERANWLQAAVKDDVFGKQLVDAGMAEAMIKDWSVDPQVVIDSDGKKASIFDQLEDIDSSACAEKLMSLSKLNKD